MFEPFASWDTNRIVTAVFVIPLILLIIAVFYNNLKKDKGDK